MAMDGEKVHCGSHRVSLVIEHATPADLAAVRAFNQRLRDGQGGFQLPEGPELFSGSHAQSAPVWQEFYLAKEPGAVRGGYLLKREPLWIGRSLTELWNYQLPLSEGIVDRAHAMVGIRLLQDATKRAELLYCLGMGSLTRPLPRLLSRFKWSVESVPFFFRVIRSSGFLKNIDYLRSRGAGRTLTWIARYSGLGALATGGWRLAARVRGPRVPPDLRFEEVFSFGSEVDELFSATRNSYGALIERTAGVLNIRYPTGDPRLIRLMLRHAARLIGWVVLTRSDLAGHKQFGDMRLGCIVDGICAPETLPVMIAAATDRLVAEGVDLIVSNQTHASWTAGLRRCGYASGPSNYVFARSPALAASGPSLEEWHINRGDGDGPINL